MNTDGLKRKCPICGSEYYMILENVDTKVTKNNKRFAVSTCPNCDKNGGTFYSDKTIIDLSEIDEDIDFEGDTHLISKGDKLEERKADTEEKNKEEEDENDKDASIEELVTKEYTTGMSSKIKGQCQFDDEGNISCNEEEEESKEKEEEKEEVGKLEEEYKKLLCEREEEIKELKGELENQDFYKNKYSEYKRRASDKEEEMFEWKKEAKRLRNENEDLKETVSNNVGRGDMSEKEELDFLRENNKLKDENSMLKERLYDIKDEFNEKVSKYENSIVKLSNNYEIVKVQLDAVSDSLMFYEKKMCATCNRFTSPVKDRSINNCTVPKDSCPAKLLFETVKMFRNRYLAQLEEKEETEGN